VACKSWTLAYMEKLLDNAAQASRSRHEKTERQAAESGPSVKDLEAKIGQLTMENGFLEGALGRIHGLSAKR